MPSASVFCSRDPRPSLYAVSETASRDIAGDLTTSSIDALLVHQVPQGHEPLPRASIDEVDRRALVSLHKDRRTLLVRHIRVVPDLLAGGEEHRPVLALLPGDDLFDPNDALERFARAHSQRVRVDHQPASREHSVTHEPIVLSLEEGQIKADLQARMVDLGDNLQRVAGVVGEWRMVL